MNQSVVERIKSPGPKKILACDGGGIRGLMSVEILARIEADLRSRLHRPNLVLGDWFDFVCGTSTGAIIASCIACGMSMDELRDFYVGSGKEMFDRASLLLRLRYSYNDEPLAQKLRAEINRALGAPPGAAPALLGDDRLRTMLMMVMRNHTTDSPWPVSNNPFAKYNQPSRKDCNLNLPLWQLVRASTAAPTYFPPETVVFAEGTPQEYQFVFVDGGVTTYNNPAFLAFLMATADPYKVNWATGSDKLLIVSVGTGNVPDAQPGVNADDLWLYSFARGVPTALMNAATAGWDMACRTLGKCRFGRPIDRESGDMVLSDDGAENWTGPKQFTYVRYDPDLSSAGLDALGVPEVKPEDVQQLDSIDHVSDIQRIGQEFARQFVRPDHLESFNR